MSRAEETRQARKKRIPLGGLRQKLTTPQREGYIRRWFNDTAGRLQNAEGAGYTFVTDISQKDVGEAASADLSRKMGMGSKISQIIGTHENGNPITAYLMEIPKEYYDEDQNEKQSRIRRQEKDILDGADQHGQVGKDGRYIPRGGIKMNRNQTHG